MLNNTEAVKPYSAITGVLIVIFSMVSVMSADWVRGKIYLGIIGVVCAGMATATAFGTLMYIGIPFISINKIIPFLMIGIGIDDMFVVLASWRRTKIQDPITKRLSETYSDAGVSITITSLTNMLSFSVGITTPILGVQIFCIYTGRYN
ncbi:Patched domain-containing protein 3, partial [Armadillidium nasatum]